MGVSYREWLVTYLMVFAFRLMGIHCLHKTELYSVADSCAFRRTSLKAPKPISQPRA